MRHYKKILTVVVIVLVLAVIAMIAAVRFLPETDLIRNSLRDRLSELTGQDVRLGALKVSISFPSLINLTLEGVSVSSREGKSLLQAGTIAFSPSLASIFSRQVLIESVVIRRLKVILRRARDGRMENPFASALQSYSAVVRQKDNRVGTRRTVPAEGGEAPAISRTHGREPRLKWSVNTLKIVDARIELIDREIVPGEPAKISLDKINCTLRRQKTGNRFSLNLEGELTGENHASNPIHADGTISLTEDLTQLLSANVNFSLESLDLKGLQDYVPPWARPVERFDIATSTAQLTWKSNDDARLSFKIDVSGKSREAPQLKFQGVAVVTRDFSRLLEIRGTGESDRLPLRLFTRYLPKGVPLDPGHGTFKTSVEGRWAANGTWNLQGNVGLEGAVTTGRFIKIAPKVRIQTEFKLTPNLLKLESLEISASKTLAVVSGTIEHPLSRNRNYDLEGRLNLNPSWLRTFGVRVPKNLTIHGTVPFHGRVGGRRERLWVDLTGDLTSTGIKWAPYVEKEPGNRGTITIKGNLLLSRGRRKRRGIPEVDVRVGLSRATVRIRPDGPRLSKCAIDFTSKVLFTSGGSDFKGAALALRRGSGARNIMIARADITDVGSESGRIHGNATLNLNRTTLALTGLEIPRGVKIRGSTQLRTSFNGSLKAFDWSVNIPLTYLDVQVDRTFRKPGGVKGDLVASGKWALEELTMNSCRLTLPGLIVTGNGGLRDKSGKFLGMTLSTRNAKLQQMAGLFPWLSGKGLSGGIDLTVHLRPSSKGLLVDGKLRLLGVDYHPQNAAWKIDNMRGTLVGYGGDIESSGLTGKLKGPVEAPLTVKGKLTRVQSPNTMNGQVSFRMGKGHIQAGRLQSTLGRARVLLDALFRPGRPRNAGNRLEFDSATGTITISSGIAKTQDIQMKGPDLALGAMGSYRLKSSNLDMLLGIKTYTIAPSIIAKIPAVTKLVKQHEGLLKALGVDKELKRLGLGSDKDSVQTGGAEIKKTPVTVILRLTGQASSPHVVPVLESALTRDTAVRIKSLLK